MTTIFHLQFWSKAPAKCLGLLALVCWRVVWVVAQPPAWVPWLQVLSFWATMMTMVAVLAMVAPVLVVWPVALSLLAMVWRKLHWHPWLAQLMLCPMAWVPWVAQSEGFLIKTPQV